MEKCPVCLGNRGFTEKQISPDVSYVECERCGKYKIDVYMVITTLNHYGDSYFLSGLIRREYEFGIEYHITEQSIKDLLSAHYIPSTPFDYIDLLIEYVAKKTRFIGEFVTLISSSYFPVIFAKNTEEFDYTLDKAIQLDLLENQNRTEYCLTLDGWRKVEEIRKGKKDNKRAFVAMWFGAEMEDAWIDGFKKALKDTGFKPIRIDFEEHNGKICDRIIAKIKKSRLMIVDVTGHRHNVYFEAGYALGSGLDIIWTCRKDHMDELNNKFDTRQYAHIVWADTADLKNKLINRIEATIISHS